MKNAIAIMAALGTGAAAQAQDLRFFATGSFVFGEPRLFEFDPGTGAILSDTRTSGIVSSGRDDELKGIEFTPDGTLYGFTHVPNTRLYSIDPDTAVGAQVGDDFLIQAFEGGIAPIDNERAYMTTGNTASEGFLLEVNLVTGRETVLNQLSRPADISGLGLRSDGMLVGLDARGIELPEQLVTIDPTTSEITTLAVLDTTNDGVVAGMSIVGDTGYFIYSDNAPDWQPELWSFDLFTGEQTFLTTIDANAGLTGLAILVPSPGAGALLAGAGLIASRRRR